MKSVRAISLALIALCLLAVAAAGPIGAKKDPDEPFYLHEHLSTKSPYFPLAGPEDHTPPPPGCKAVYLNFVARFVPEAHCSFLNPFLIIKYLRHGARVPSKGDIVALSNLQKWVAANAAAIAANASLSWMPGWRNPYSVDHQQQLVELGEMQHYNISRRMARDYPEIFNVTQEQLEIYPRVFTIRATEVSRYVLPLLFLSDLKLHRASQSGVSFAYGLFEGKGDLGSMNLRSFYVYTLPKNEDKELRFFKQCPAFEIEVRNRPTTPSPSCSHSKQLLFSG